MPFHGWQVQPNGVTVQEVIERALTTILRAPTKIVGAGRTDAGVHAKGQVANFQIEQPLSISCRELCRSLNGILKDAVTIHKVSVVPEAFNSRYSATSRSYTYSIARIKKSIGLEYFHTVTFPLDIPIMEEAARLFLGQHDFLPFSVATGEKSTLCTVSQLDLESTEASLLIHITANRFLHQMVRMIVGTLIEVGRGTMTCEDIKKRLSGVTRERTKGYCVPAKGLCLTAVGYPLNCQSLESVEF